MNDKEEYNKIIRKRWYVQGFNSCLNYIMHGPVSSLVGMHKYLGYGYTETLFIFKKDYLEYHYLEDDFERCGNEFIKRFENDQNYFSEIHEIDKKLVTESLKTIDKVRASIFNDLTKKELIELYQETFTAYHQCVDVSHLIESISYVLEPLIKEKLEKELGLDRHDKKFRAIFEILTQPERPSFVNEEQISLLEIAKLIKEEISDFDSLPENIKKLIHDHKEHFFYNQLNYYHGEPLTELDYLNQLKKWKTDNVNITGLINDEKERYSRNKETTESKIKELRLNKDTVKYINLLINTLHWQDDRKKYILSSVYCMNLLLKEIAKRYDIDIAMLKCYVPYDITELFLENFDKEGAKKRVESYSVYFWREDGEMKSTTYVGDQNIEFLTLYYKDYTTESDLHGMCASAGSAQGQVKVCLTKDDLDKVNEGDILVAPMTRPEYVPAMRKASAIITDEGGITCHAAIVSRELGIPCVIGTKIATKVLKDDMFVEVRANHGLVRIEK